MARRKNRKIKLLLLSLFTVIVLGFSTNWFLTYQLEDFLRQKLNEKVAEATNGFYTLSFDRLSVGLFNGELHIAGLDIRPDSLVFESWAKTNNLPQTYFNIRINRIDFKGVNLAWRTNYRNLHFDLFEISNPKLEIISPYGLPDNSISDSEKPQNVYDMVSSFFDEVKVKTLNLENATISYSVYNTRIPSVYALKDVSFHAYDFLLDQHSSENGKLLYCNNFDFATNTKQRLLANNLFTLDVNNIKLSTADSSVQINGVELMPQRELWKEANTLPTGVIDARIENIEGRGISFKRKKGKTFLDVGVFDILSSKIGYADIDTIMQNKIKTEQKENMLKVWSLYEIVSPILSKISIAKIGIEKTTFQYSTITEKGRDIYSLDNFAFWAKGFRVDSLSDIDPKLFYSENFGFAASNFIGKLTSKNHLLHVGKIALNTESGEFYVKNTSLAPISTKNKYDYIAATIDSVIIGGLQNNKGISANNLRIKSSDIKYTRNTNITKEKTTHSTTNNQDNTLKSLSSLISYFYIKNIILDKVKLAYNIRHKDISEKIELKNLNVSVSDFRIDEQIRKNEKWGFYYSDFKFNLSNFDNYILNNQYRLSAKKVLFTGLKGKLKMLDVKLQAQEDMQAKALNRHLNFASPLLELDGIDFENKRLNIKSLKLNSPQIGIVKEHNLLNDKRKVGILDLPLANLLIENLNVENAKLEYVDNTEKSTLHSNFDRLKVTKVNFGLPTNRLQITSFDLSGGNVNTHSQKQKTDLRIDSLQLSALDWKIGGDDSHFLSTEISLLNPYLYLNTYLNNDDTASKQKTNIGKSNVYALLGQFANKISVGKFDLINTNIDYNYSSAGIKPIQQKLNEINLSLQGLDVDAKTEKIKLEDASFSTKNLSFPVANNFYTMKIGNVKLLKKGSSFELSDLRMKSNYPKMQFSYQHPQNKDWFDVAVGSLRVSDINIPDYFSNDTLNIGDVQINDVSLQNFKNRNIKTPPRLVPMIYRIIQNAPVKFNAKNVDVNNFSVVYEELATNGDTPGKIFFTEMKGHFAGLSNIVSKPNEYNKLYANGKLMGKGYFDATWSLPVDSLNDRFLLDAHLQQFDLKELNQLIEPMAPVKIAEGNLQNVMFSMDASSLGSRIEMLMLYNNLKLSVFKEKRNELVDNKFASLLINRVLKQNNPNKLSNKPRRVDIYVDRDPYHSTFNYLWQILQPALIESIGISQKKQNFFRNLPKIPEKLANFFWKMPKEELSKTKKKSLSKD